MRPGPNPEFWRGLVNALILMTLFYGAIAYLWWVYA